MIAATLYQIINTMWIQRWEQFHCKNWQTQVIFAQMLAILSFYILISNLIQQLA